MKMNMKMRMKEIMTKNTIKRLIWVGLFFSSIFATFLLTYHAVKPVPYEDFEDRIEEIVSESHYYFLPKEIADYIIESCSNLGIDPDMCVAILINENPRLDFEALNKNPNGTIDVGLWQLNDRYLWTTFSDSFWRFDDVELNPFNWKHNTYIALRLIQDHCKTFSTFNERVMAYNCGAGAVINDKIPESTKRYLASAKINYGLLKSGSYDKVH